MKDNFEKNDHHLKQASWWALAGFMASFLAFLGVIDPVPTGVGVVIIVIAIVYHVKKSGNYFKLR